MKEYIAPWEQAFERILTPIEEFIHRQTTSGILLMLCAVTALVLANSQWAEGYHYFLKTYISIGVGEWKLSMSLHHWINDGLMALFFFVVGLELKRELLVGELSNLKAAMLPIVAAIGGMVVPALIYFSLNPTGDRADGWGIPMATDIAFALGVLALLGNRVPKVLLGFLVALAIVDDLGAVLVIAIFYTEQLNFTALIAAGAVLLLLASLNLGGVRKPLPYVLLGLLLWFATLKSGVHATLAGVFLAFIIPIRPKYEPERFLRRANELLKEIGENFRAEPNIIKNYKMRAKVRALETGIHRVQAPAQVLEHNMHIPTAYFIIPIFALANAGVPIEWSELGNTITNPVSMGVVSGLVLGKLLGIAGFVWLALKVGIGVLPAQLNMKHIIGVSLLGGIGFTMSIFIAELGFANSPEDLLMAKTGILFASLIAGVSGYLWLLLNSKKPAPTAN
ncbi:MAG: Na+/H+ antiporter NhaA type [uncultured Thiotrichaceae bacterium]|uniref:Na(+)/H(+) antiporter NhaA n=1 Tax=uncultured Thiotrichaceae bacterium TaxID=298394 RepID=A0A6S6ULG6_9GAMM|nr:MAG: Na+/H+ antiporter NhaA type [uncultured Thiotrichaceae bacterium]